jgi:hypothetical protein
MGRRKLWGRNQVGLGGGAPLVRIRMDINKEKIGKNHPTTVR